MNCMYCGEYVGARNICPRCGGDLSVQRKADQLSKMCYNEGLDKAQIRDLSGAIDMLERSLKYDKRNIDARNLLGLVYFEVGETVSALSEWIISKNLKPEDNIASEFIEKVQARPEQLNDVQRSIRKYNDALEACRNGNEDIAEIILKKVLGANPNLVKAYHLLALLYMKKGEYEKARRVLKEVSPIDRTNSTTLRFLQEIEEQTGTPTDTDGRRFRLSLFRIKKPAAPGRRFRLRKAGKKGISGTAAVNQVIDEFDADTISDDPVIQPAAFRETTFFSTILNILIGLVVGVLVVSFLVIPALKQDIARKANEQVAKYTVTMASQNALIQSLEEEIRNSNQSTIDANEQVSESNRRSEAYEKVFQAYNAYTDGDYDTALALASEVDVSLLNVDARLVYDNIISITNDSVFEDLSARGITAFENGKYDDAIKLLVQARALNPGDYNTLSYLAHSYRMNNQINEAVEVFEDIIERFPDTTRATTAQDYINMLTH